MALGGGSSLSSQQSSWGLWSARPPAGLVLGGVGGEKAPVGACLDWPRVLAHPEGSGPKDTLEKPKPGGHCLMLELPGGGGSTKAKPPREFPFWKLGTSPFYDIFQGRGKEHWLSLQQ